MAGYHSDRDNMGDPAFEPRSDFHFGDGGDDEFANMQRNLDAMNSFNASNSRQGIHSMNGMDADCVSDNFNPAFMQSLNPMNSFLFEDGNLSPDSTSWGMNMQTQSMQSNIVNSRGMSVAHQFGQITPPDDDGSKTLAAPTIPSSMAPATQASNAKSERARNAANQRHAKAKKARKDSIRNVEKVEDGEDDEVEDKRERYREKNRLAAAKCRAKKKTNTEDLEESARSASALNSRLKAEERELRDLFSSLRDHALAHDPSQGCNCQAIHAYNMHKAQETARATMGFVPGIMPSPSQRSIDSASPSTVGATSRTQSFSGGRPRMTHHSSRAHSQSLASPMDLMPLTPQSTTAFAPSTTGNGLRASTEVPEDLQQHGRGTSEGR